MTYQKSDTVNLFFLYPCAGQKLLYHRSAFYFLKFTVGISIFLPTQRTGYVMCDSRYFKGKLSFFVQIFQFTDGPGISPNTNEMIDVMDVSIRECNHLLHDL